MKYIDADRLKAEIESYRKECEDSYGDPGDNDFPFGKVTACREIIEIIDSLQQEQPEVDINGEIHKEAMKLHTAPTYDELARFARHFYELGLNAKEESK